MTILAELLTLAPWHMDVSDCRRNDGPLKPDRLPPPGFLDLLRACRYSFHDLSRVMLSKGVPLQRSLIPAVMAILLLAGCAPLSPEAKLKNEVMLDVYWTTVRQCEKRHATLRMTNLTVDGDLSLTGAVIVSELGPFTECYHAGIRQAVERRRRAGLPVPDTLKLEPHVEIEVE